MSLKVTAIFSHLIFSAESAIQRGYTVSDIVEAETLKNDREQHNRSSDSMDNSPTGSITHTTTGNLAKVRNKFHHSLLAKTHSKDLSNSKSCPSIQRALNPLCCYIRKYYLPLPNLEITSNEPDNKTIKKLLHRAQSYKSLIAPSNHDDFWKTISNLPYIDDAPTDIAANSVYSTPQVKPRRNSIHRLIRAISHQILPEIQREYDPQIGKYAVSTLDGLSLPAESGSEVDNAQEVFSLGVPSIEDDANESIQDGAEAAEADDPFNDHWNCFKYNCQERPIAVDLGYDDIAKTFWNNDFYNNAKYNAGTPWHDLVGMFSNNALATQQADKEEMEAEGSWNPSDWNSSDIGQAESYLIADNVLGDIISEDNESENQFLWLFGESYFIDNDFSESVDN